MTVQYSVPMIMVCCSPSVGRWWREFCKVPVVKYVEWFSDSKMNLQQMLDALATHRSQTVSIVVLSEHETLLRDSALVEYLRSAGHFVVGIDSKGALFEYDKRRIKKVLKSVGVRLPDSSISPSGIQRPLFKACTGTRGETVSWNRSDPRTPGYWEQFIHGTEYSAIAVVHAQTISVLPLVWKGTTATSLKPPYKRLRLAGFGITPSLAPDVFAQLHRLAPCLPRQCFIEAEFIVDDAGRAYLIEVNPRIAGTTRIAAMASGCAIIDIACLHDSEPHDKIIESIRICAELPVVDGRENANNIPEVTVTSRITLAATCRGQLWEKLRLAEQRGVSVDPEARAQLQQLVLAEPEASRWVIEGCVAKYA